MESLKKRKVKKYLHYIKIDATRTQKTTKKSNKIPAIMHGIITRSRTWQQ